ncbi:major facilitator superfamily MFS_1 [Methylobacterium sp. 4-46]|uniref:MFS transporter n=1 Tax=unclassified Methylobacterium TaxID=2615210 RepID=UPI000165CDEC|nr:MULTISPECIES: MFS transporter [Methylobacterium]ACA20751.1 major facilitator superfamily MFS_1 [Methylobacterium sp. 4-46]WFT79902.1 MFS transporter [Methylobacterium nodulans]
MTAFLVLLLAYTISQFDRGFLAMVAPDLGRDLGLSGSDLALLSSAWFAAFALAQIPTGFCLDRFGPRRTVAAFLALASLGTGALAAAGGFAGALAGMALIGFGCAPALMGSLYVFGRLYPPERFAMLSSLMIGFGTAGDLLGATPLALASRALGWRPILLGLAAVTAACALLVLALIRDPARIRDPTRTGLLRGFAAIAGMRALWPIFPVVLVSYAVVIAIRSLWIGAYLGSVHGFDALARGNGALAMSAAMALGAIGYGPLERLVRDPKRTALGGCLVTGLALVLLGLAGAGSAALAVALLAVIGAAGLSYAILMAHARRFFPAHLLGRGVSFMNILFMGGAGAAQGLSAAFVLRAEGLDPAGLYARLFAGFGAALLAATAVYAFAPRAPALSATLPPPPPPRACAPAGRARGGRA